MAFCVFSIRLAKLLQHVPETVAKAQFLGSIPAKRNYKLETKFVVWRFGIVTRVSRVYASFFATNKTVAELISAEELTPSCVIELTPAQINELRNLLTPEAFSALDPIARLAHLD